MSSKRGSIVLGAILIIVLILLALAAFLFFRKNLLKSFLPPQAFEAVSVSTPSSTKIAFIREGDVWISSITGSEQKQLTKHTPIIFNHLFYVNGAKTQRIIDGDYAKSPRVSGDGRYLAYLILTDKAQDIQAEWQEKVKAEQSKEVNEREFEFYPPYIPYVLKIIDLETGQEIDISPFEKANPEYFEDIVLLPWAHNKNILPFYSYKGYMFLAENPQGGFTLKSLDYDFFKNKPFNEENTGGEWERPGNVKISPDGNYLLATYAFTNQPEGCFNTIGSKVSLVDLVKRKLTKIVLNKQLVCNVHNVGWYDKNSLILESYPDYNFQFSYFTPSSPIPVKMLGYRGSVSQESISPDGKWLSYLIQNIDTKEQEYVFFTRTADSYEAINLFGYMGGESLTNQYNEVFAAKWDRNSQIAYIKMAKTEDKIQDIIRFDPVTKSYSKLLENVSEFDVN